MNKGKIIVIFPDSIERVAVGFVQGFIYKIGSEKFREQFEVQGSPEFVKGFISGEELEIRDNKEGAFSILKNDIYSLVNKKNEQIKNTAQRYSRASQSTVLFGDLKKPLKKTGHSVFLSES